MAGSSEPQRTSCAETKLESEIAQLQSQQPLRERMAAVARELGFELGELREEGRMVRRNSFTPKYRDPKNPMNTWAGRGRKPLWLVAATKDGKAKKEDFLIEPD